MFRRPQVEEFEPRLTPDAALQAAAMGSIAPIQAAMPTSNIDASQVNMAVQQSASAFQYAESSLESQLAAGTLTFAQAAQQQTALVTQRNTLLVESNTLMARLTFIGNDCANSGYTIGGLKAAAYAVEVWQASSRVTEIKNELASINADLAALHVQFPTLPPAPPPPTAGGPFVPGAGTTAPYVPITPPAWGD